MFQVARKCVPLPFPSGHKNGFVYDMSAYGWIELMGMYLY